MLDVNKAGRVSDTHKKIWFSFLQGTLSCFGRENGLVSNRKRAKVVSSLTLRFSSSSVLVLVVALVVVVDGLFVMHGTLPYYSFQTRHAHEP